MPTLVRMTEVQYLAYVGDAIPGYAAEQVTSGQWSQEEALGLAHKAYQELLPQGLNTPDNYFYAVQDSQGNSVGTLWVAVQNRAGKRIAYLYDISIKPEHRRRGFAKSALLALEEQARTLGLSGIALHVFGHNSEAQALYTMLGYQTTDISMFKSLARPGA